VVAAGLRIAGMAFDRPYVYYPDEYAIVKPALDMVATGDPDPHTFTYPSFLIYAETGIVQVVHAVTGAPLTTPAQVWFGGLPGSGPSDLAQDLYQYDLWGRRLVGLLGVLTVLLLAFPGRVAALSLRRRKVSSTATREQPKATRAEPDGARSAAPENGEAGGTPRGPSTSAWDREVGWLAGLVGAGFYALAVLPLDYSRFLTTDIPSAFFTAATLIAAVAAVSRPPDRTSNRFLILSGLFAGMAASTKYNAAVVAIVPAIAYLSRAGSLQAIPTWLRGAVRSRTPYLTALAAVVAFVVITPMIIFDTGAVINDLTGVIFHYNVQGHPGAQGDTIGYYVNYLWTTGFGPVLSVLALAGIVWALVRHRASDLVLVVFPIVYFLLVSIPEVHFERDLMPMVPFLALLAGRFVADTAATVYELIGRRRRFLGAVAATVLIALVAVQPAAAAVQDARVTRLPRTETIARNWVYGHLMSGSAIVREEYTPQLDPYSYRVGYTWTLSTYDLAWYRSHGFRYAIASSRLYDRYFAPGYPTEAAFYNELFSLPVVYEIQPSSTVTGPTIIILDLQPGLAAQQARSP